MSAPSARLLQRVLLAATGVTSIVTGCGGQIDDSLTSTSAAGGSSANAGAGGSLSTGGSAGSSSVGGAGGASGSAGKQAGGSAGGSSVGGAGGAAGSIATGGSAGIGGTSSTGGAAGIGGTSSTGGAGGFGGTSGKAGGAGSVSTGGAAGAGGSVACLPGACAPGQVTCGSGVSSLFTCQLGPDGCGQWIETPCATGTVCSSEQGACVPTTPTTCKAGVACVGGEWCSPSPQIGASDSCFCPITDSPEKLSCGQPYPWGMNVKVCYDAGDAACMALGDPNLYTVVDQRFHLQCSSVQTGPTTEATSSGEARCCYTVGVFGCVGRPMFIDTGLRVAQLTRSSGWI